MKPTASGVARIVGAILAAGVSAAFGANRAHKSHGDQLEEVIFKINALSATVGALSTTTAAVQSDVRLLKCANDFPGDCPGQARPAEHHAR